MTCNITNFGGIKFFNESVALKRDGASATATSNSVLADNVLTNDRRLYWQSLGSDDLTTETLTINFPSTLAINRLFMTQHNFKEYTVKYLDGITPTDFTNIVTINNEIISPIAYTDYALDTSYFEFDEVQADGLEITITTTQTVDAEKIIFSILAMTEIGQFDLYPDLSTSLDSNNSKQRTLNGKYDVQKGFLNNSFGIKFSRHFSQNDSDLLQTLFLREDPFYMYPNAGFYGEEYFTPYIYPYRLQDLFTVQTDTKLSSEYGSNSYVGGGHQAGISLDEVIG